MRKMKKEKAEKQKRKRDRKSVKKKIYVNFYAIFNMDDTFTKKMYRQSLTYVN